MPFLKYGHVRLIERIVVFWLPAAIDGHLYGAVITDLQVEGVRVNGAESKLKAADGVILFLSQIRCPHPGLSADALFDRKFQFYAFD